MVSLLTHLRRPRRPELIVECRRCGTTVEPSHVACPTCGGTGFAEYDIPD